MSEQRENLLPTGYDAISEMARNLARTLQAAPAQESRRAAALRQYLLTVVSALANASDGWQEETDSPQERREGCCELIEQIRKIAAELASVPSIVPPGITVVWETFAEAALPGSLLVLRPASAFDYGGVEYLEKFRVLAREIGLNCGVEPNDIPNRFLVLHYPQGEQDNVLLSCVLMRKLSPPLPETVLEANTNIFAMWALGPAYFFALATAAEANPAPYTPSPHSAAYFHLFTTASNLKAAGWFDHPQLGPLLEDWNERLGLNQGRTIAGPNENSWARTQERWQEYAPGLRPYTPEDFDRDVPRLWERLRQLIPPNDLDTDGVESAQPADAVSILNAGWSFALLHMEDLYRILGSKSAEDRYEAKQVLNRLLTKGIELSRIAQRWKEAREGA